MRPVIPLSLALTAATAGGIFVHKTQAAQAPPLFTEIERKALVTYWNAPGRYSVEVAPVAPGKPGPWAVRLTPEGSSWFLTYQRAVLGGKKIPPSQTAKGGVAEWESWIDAKIAWDKFQAQKLADAANGANTVTVASAGPSPMPKPQAMPSYPGPAPAALLAAAGNPPAAFHSAITPMQYTIRFDDNDEPYIYRDNVRFDKDRFAYYRFAKGVVSYGKRVKDIPETELAILFNEAGFSACERKCFAQVSALEGGFETTQTYDTGYVSVGFIQFVTMADGSGEQDICKALALEKKENPAAFQQDFRQFGLDIQTDRTLTVVDPATGAELSGKDAVTKIIEDKRLTAIWQRAGRRSAAYRVAQIKQAKASYWPENDPISVPLADGTKLTGTISDVIKSEAGLATLLDRKINTGNIRPFVDIVAKVMADNKLKTLAQATKYEKPIVAELTYRRSFLEEPTLGQPPAPPSPKPTRTAQVSRFDLFGWLRDLLRR
ncbi:hypothetical protein [Armatimonas sp.]|uniref:hypothetical protein n=1 Tax=Armatimonas sp. TaxID=1872638 RepID=UPI0037519B93